MHNIFESISIFFVFVFLFDLLNAEKVHKKVTPALLIGKLYRYFLKFLHYCTVMSTVFYTPVSM